MNIRHALLILASIAGTTPAFAAPLALASVFSDNAVIQRDRPAPIWGQAEPGAKIDLTISKDGQTVYETKTDADASGKWLAKTKPFAAGGPYTITLASSEGDSLTITNILFGDIWICSGQSNMGMTYGSGLTRGKEDVENNTYPEIRLLNVPKQASILPMKSFVATWAVCTPEAAKKFSAVGYFFGAALQQELPDVPIGLVDITWGATYIQTWLSLESIEQVEELADSAAARRKNITDWLNGASEKHVENLAAWKDSLDTFSAAAIKPWALDFDDSGWETVVLPRTFEDHVAQRFDGVVWYRTSVELTADQAAAATALSLGRIDDEDVAYINAVQVGATGRGDVERKYAIPRGLLKEGANSLVVRVLDAGHVGGFTGKPEALFIAAGASVIPLGVEWKYHANKAQLGSKPVDLNAPPANSYSACYNGMFAPIFPLAVKGAIWYQGCANICGEKLYFKLFNAMVDDWRTNLTGGDFPVYLVQLAAYRQTNEAPHDSAWARMRWVMTQLGETVKNCGTAIAIDVGDHIDLHPKDKKTVGERLARLARLALNRTYGRKHIVEAGPIPTGVARSEQGIVVSFKNAVGLKTSDAAEVSGFQVVDGDGKAVWAKAKIAGETVVVSVPESTAVSAVRFAWDDYPVCNLVNAESLPCGPFAYDVK